MPFFFIAYFSRIDFRFLFPFLFFRLFFLSFVFSCFLFVPVRFSFFVHNHGLGLTKFVPSKSGFGLPWIPCLEVVVREDPTFFFHLFCRFESLGVIELQVVMRVLTSTL